MAAWLIPALKTIGPHIGTILSVAVPVFTKRAIDKDSAQSAAGQAASQGSTQGNNQTALLQQQINELQTAVSLNAVNIKELAAQLQKTVDAIDQAAEAAQSRLKRAVLLSMVAAALAVVSALVALGVVMAQ
jgi:monoamine oxidase